MPSIQTAWQWAVDTCNAPNVGYSQTYRDQQTVGGITYYDCSSFIWYALVAGGFPLSGYPFATATMVGELLQIGFTYADINGLWVAGDIVWRDGHCEMVYSGSTGYGITMGAHSSTLPLDDQVSINSNPSYASSYTYLLRYTGGSTGRQWYRDPSNHGSLTQAQAENNALCLRDWFVANTDWTLQAIAGMAANVEGESDFNPESMENPSYPIPTPGADGLGLVQWTSVSGDPTNPLLMIIEYLYGASATSDWGDPIKQCNAIMAEYGKSTGTIPPVTVPNFDPGWIATTAYPVSWSTWAHSTGDPGDLALAFQANYERPLVLDPDREIWARRWYQFFLDNPYIPPSPVPGRRKGMPLWMMIRYRY